MTTLGAFFLAGRLLLAAIFTLAGVTKLLDRPGTRRTLTDFGIPETIATPSAVLLPMAEIAVAIALLPTGLARYGALAALALSLLFIAGMANSLAHGRRPDCHCFGQVYAAPIGWQTLVRNCLLVVVAAFVVVAGWGDPGPSIVAWIVPLTPFQRAVVCGGAAAIALLGLQSALLVSLVRRYQAAASLLATPAAVQTATSPLPVIDTATAGLPVGAAAPSFALPSLDGERVTLATLLVAGKPTVLLFSDPHCGPCNALLPEIGRWEQEIGQDLTLALISRGTVEANRAKSSEHGLPRVLLQRDREVAQAYAVIGTPSAVLIHPDGRIGTPLVQGADAIRTLVTDTTALPLAGQPESPRQSVADQPSALSPMGIRPAPTIAVPPDARPVQEECVHDEFLEDGTMILYNGCREQTLTLNPTAALVWECCDGDHDIGAIVAEVRDVFPEAPDAERDVRALVHALTEAGMVSCATT